jgi:hypothetical protein
MIRASSWSSVKRFAKALKRGTLKRDGGLQSKSFLPSNRAGDALTADPGAALTRPELQLPLVFGELTGGVSSLTRFPTSGWGSLHSCVRMNHLRT